MPEALPELEEWQDWLLHPCTHLLRTGLKARRENLKEKLAEGDFVEPTSALLNIAVVAQCKLLRDLSDLDYELIIAEIDDA